MRGHDGLTLGHSLWSLLNLLQRANQSQTTLVCSLARLFQKEVPPALPTKDQQQHQMQPPHNSVRRVAVTAEAAALSSDSCAGESQRDTHTVSWFPADA